MRTQHRNELIVAAFVLFSLLQGGRYRINICPAKKGKFLAWISSNLEPWLKFCLWFELNLLLWAKANAASGGNQLKSRETPISTRVS